MTDYTARNVLLKDSSGNYLIPYTEKADLSLGNLNSAGKAYVAIKGYDSTATYSLNEVVMTVVSGSVLFYRSLVDNNTASLSDTTKWSEVSFGSGANVDLSNLSNTGEAHFANPALTNSPYTTNRILEIPQNIQLELNNGTLTLKAGSKVYVPNGFESDGTTPKFDIVTIDTDKTATDSAQRTLIIGISTDGNIQFAPEGETGSPAVSTYKYYYDRNANKCYVSTTGVYFQSTFPLCIATSGSNGFTSIDQVFNGFGYIGSTAFILPGVKVQAPNGKNEDGSYKSNILTQSSVGLTTFTANANGALVVRPNSGTPLFSSSWHFDSENGYISTSDNIPTNKGSCILCGYLRTESLRIVDFTFGNADSVANSNASNFSQAGRSYLSGLGMPDTANAQLVSNSFATKTNFTAPDNGWYCCRAISTTTNANMALFITSINASNNVVPPYNGGTFPAITTSGTARQVLLPVEVGQKIQVQYSNADIAGDAYCGLWFIPAKGEN